MRPATPARLAPAVLSAQTVRQLMAPWQWFGTQGTPLGRRLRTALWLAVLAVTAAIAWRWLPPPLLALVLTLQLAIVLLALWGGHFAALLRLDHPNAARLVPGHAAALRRGALLLWAATTATAAGAVVTLLTWAPLPDRWLVGPGVLPVALVAAGALFLLLALALRWPLLWFPIALLPVSGRTLGVLLQAVQPHWQARPWLACAALLGAMALALAALFGRGGSAHARVWAQRERWSRVTRAGLVGQKPTLAAYGRWGEWLGAPWQRLADAWLAHALRHAQPGAGSAMTRAEIVLHGAQHWVRQLGVLLPLLLGLVVLFGGLAWRAGPDDAAQIFEHGHVGMGIGLVCMVLGAVVSLPGALWVSRREQALLLLLPGMPRGAALNRALAWRQARHCLLIWALTLPAWVAVAWAGRAPQGLVLPLLSLLSMAWLWRDAARQQEPSASMALLPFVACLVPGLASVVVLRERPDLLAPLLAGVALAGAGLLLWRWRRLSRWPQALPAGRLG